MEHKPATKHDFRTKEGRAAYRREYLEANREKLNADSLAYYYATRPQRLARMKQWREVNREARNASSKQWREAHPLYHPYKNMLERCLNPNADKYQAYGERGITIDSVWLGENGFAQFEKDMGPRPTEKHQIHRVCNDGPYSKENCVWSVDHSQMCEVNALSGRKRGNSVWFRQNVLSRLGLPSFELSEADLAIDRGRVQIRRMLQKISATLQAA